MIAESMQLMISLKHEQIAQLLGWPFQALCHKTTVVRGNHQVTQKFLSSSSLILMFHAECTRVQGSALLRTCIQTSLFKAFFKIYILWIQLSEVNGLNDWTLKGERKAHRAGVELDIWFTIKIEFACNTFSKSKEENMAGIYVSMISALFVRMWEWGNWIFLGCFFLTNSYAYVSLNSIFTLHLPPTLKGLVCFVAFHAKTNSLFREKYLCKPTLQLITFFKGFVNSTIKKKAEKCELCASHAEPIGILKWERREITHY